MTRKEKQMKKTTVDVIAKKQEELVKLQAESNNALNLVTSTINQLTTTNEKIDVTISEIAEAKAKLQNTEDELTKTKQSNTKVIEKFKALIAD